MPSHLHKMRSVVMASNRFAEIDFLRGIAILLMAFYHIFYDIGVFGFLSFSTNSGLWLLLSRFTASLFVLIAGISLTLSYNHTTDPTFRKFFFRGLEELYRYQSSPLSIRAKTALAGLECSSPLS